VKRHRNQTITIMYAIHQQQPLPVPKLPTIRQRLPFNDVPSVTMIKLDRGLVQRSLLYCFEKGYFSMIRYLLQSGTGNARERDSEGRTGLMYCCFIDDDLWAQNVALSLLEYGAKIEDQDQRGLNALHYAIVTQRIILVRRFLSSIELDLDRTIDIHGNTFLHYACSTGNHDIVRLILNAMKRFSLNLNTKNHYGSTAYDIAGQLGYERCQNLLRNELILRERPLKSTAKSNISHVTIQSLNEKLLSVQNQTRSTTPFKSRTQSFLSAPIFLPTTRNIRSRSSSISSTNNNDKVTLPPPIFIDPIESRNISLKRNENLDVSLANQARTRSDFAPLPFLSQSEILTSSSSTWRDDFSKVINQFQTYKTSALRKTVHPQLSNELSCELFENLYGDGSIESHDCSNHQPIIANPNATSQKIVHLRRSSTTSVKSIPKHKK